jgi:hypothetical protein
MTRYAIIASDGRGHVIAVIRATTARRAKEKWARGYIRGGQLMEYAGGSFTVFYGGAPARIVCKAKRLPKGS